MYSQVNTDFRFKVSCTEIACFTCRVNKNKAQFFRNLKKCSHVSCSSKLVFSTEKKYQNFLFNKFNKLSLKIKFCRFLSNLLKLPLNKKRIFCGINFFGKNLHSIGCTSLCFKSEVTLI